MIVEWFEVKSLVNPTKLLLPKPGVCSTYIVDASSFKFTPHASAFKVPSKGNILMISHGVSLTPLLSVLHVLNNRKFTGKV